MPRNKRKGSLLPGPGLLFSGLGAEGSQGRGSLQVDPSAQAGGAPAAGGFHDVFERTRRRRTPMILPAKRIPSSPLFSNRRRWRKRFKGNPGPIWRPLTCPSWSSLPLSPAPGELCHGSRFQRRWPCHCQRDGRRHQWRRGGQNHRQRSAHPGRVPGFPGDNANQRRIQETALAHVNVPSRSWKCRIGAL
jgi:hypothetical protein